MSDAEVRKIPTAPPKAAGGMPLEDQMRMQKTMIEANIETWSKTRQKAVKKARTKLEQVIQPLHKEEQAAVLTLALIEVQKLFMD